MSNLKRIEVDAMGEVEVDADKLWGAQTQRSLHYFAISHEVMPREVIVCLARIKRAAALVNVELGELSPELGNAIAMAASEIIEGQHQDQFPLVVWQTGSGTQTNMNLNEVIANRASELLGGARGKDRSVNPNDHVNRGQSSNDVFPATMNLAALVMLKERVIPSVSALADSLRQKSREFSDIIKIGRTHLQDATPLTLGQEISGWCSQLEHGLAHIDSTLPHLSELALGGTAVGTGLNTHPDFAERISARLSEDLGYALTSAPNKFEAQAAHDAIVFAHGALKTLAASLTKIANDIRWLASGPRCGLGELAIPSNEPGSSIMPGKVNPTQCEALTMCAAQVMGNDVAINIGGANGNFELNVYKPMMIHNFLQSARLISDACTSFRKHCVVGIEARTDVIASYVERSLMLVTALTPHIGYANAARIAKKAHAEGTTLREAALASGLIGAEDFDRYVRPENMLGPTPK